ncbi:hypothetical protein [Aquisalibacillus elongatus]|uniref:Uncharacterized protein n=1 Tax=Aquisalibacillus elongatus TaxID=485577 RepID=A0A3N5BUD0_9BACI|nr:hypothetical protein [Aquisalibacillus elongatus]RPF53378.1 hypothetical protein EDC24_1877 [Aquisalibacillus elongatus]
MIGDILSQFIVLILAVFTILLFVKLSSKKTKPIKGSSSKGSFFISRRNQILFVYVGALTVMSVLYFVIVNQQTPLINAESSEYRELNEHFQEAKQGQNLEDESIHIVKEWEMNKPSGPLSVNYNPFMYEVNVNQVEGLENIRVTQYMRNVDNQIQEQIKPFKLNIINNEFVVEDVQTEITLRAATEEFPVRQIKDKSLFDVIDDDEIREIYKQHILIEVPAELEVESMGQ